MVTIILEDRNDVWSDHLDNFKWKFILHGDSCWYFNLCVVQPSVQPNDGDIPLSEAAKPLDHRTQSVARSGGHLLY